MHKKKVKKKTGPCRKIQLVEKSTTGENKERWEEKGGNHRQGVPSRRRSSPLRTKRIFTGRIGRDVTI